MKLILVILALGSCLGMASAHAQAISSGNPCAIGEGFQGNVTVSHVLINVGVGGGAEKIYDSKWCPWKQMADSQYAACHDLFLAHIPGALKHCDAADQMMRQIPGMEQITSLQGGAPAVATVTAPVTTAPQVAQSSTSPPAQAPVAVMAALSDTTPAPPRDPPQESPHKPCPANVPVSMSYGCWTQGPMYYK